MKFLRNGKEVYYIGDSKYYAIGSELDKKSIYKQFTYAKNIIQSSIDLEEAGIRDHLTEGYNFTPNFFISAYIPQKQIDGRWVFSLEDFHTHRLEDRTYDPIKYSSHHFENRLFDRDTLYLTHVDINLLFLIAIYARDDKYEQRDFARIFKEDIYQAFTRLLDDKYDFYLIENYSDKIIESNFKALNGKIYEVKYHENKRHLILALKSKTDVTPYAKIFSRGDPVPLVEIQKM
jgi:hypothetical protein